MTDNLLAIVDEHIKDGDEAAIMGWAIALPLDQVPTVLLAVIERRKMLQRIEQTLEAKASAEKLRGYIAPDGKEFRFGTGNKRVVSSPRQLKNALLDKITDVCSEVIYADDTAAYEQGMTINEDHPHLKALRACFEEQELKVRLRELDVFTALDPRYAEAAAPYVTWTEASKSPHLTERYVKPT